MRIGIDDTDSPAGMCTTYLAAVLVSRLEKAGIAVNEARLIRLNPNVIYKTRGNAAICLDAGGDPVSAFAVACQAVDELAELDGEETNPGVVVVDDPPAPAFYWQAVKDFCTLDEAISVLEAAGARYRGWKNCRGLIGATAAVCAELPDATFELLAYRDPENRGPRFIDRESFFAADAATTPHTWDTVDYASDLVVCVPHTPDPVLYGIRGESAAWVREAACHVKTEEPVLTQVFVTNQGTDVHLRQGRIGDLREGRSYLVEGTVASPPVTGTGGHTSFLLADEEVSVTCMAYEPTKGFRETVRQLRPGDRVRVAGSAKGGSINLEKIEVAWLAPDIATRPPLCPSCGRRMKSAGAGQGWRCRRCRLSTRTPETIETPRLLSPGWYEVPSCARRHLARPLIRRPQ
jgi:tRNA(Ile2)-agmatinylcytidine synthase